MSLYTKLFVEKLPIYFLISSEYLLCNRVSEYQTAHIPTTRSATFCMKLHRQLNWYDSAALVCTSGTFLQSVPQKCMKLSDANLMDYQLYSHARKAPTLLWLLQRFLVISSALQCTWFGRFYMSS